MGQRDGQKCAAAFASLSPTDLNLFFAVDRKHYVLYAHRLCGHCQHQKSVFGTAVGELEIVDCAEESAMQRCSDAHLSGCGAGLGLGWTGTGHWDRYWGSEEEEEEEERLPWSHVR